MKTKNKILPNKKKKKHFNTAPTERRELAPLYTPQYPATKRSRLIQRMD